MMRTPALAARRTSPRMDGRAWLIVLLGAHLALKVLLLPRALSAPLQGDEVAYADGAAALSNLVRDLVALTSPDAAAFKDDVIGNGWFMPGMSVLLTPLFLVAPDVGAPVIRLYIGLCTLALWAAAARTIDVHLGRRWTAAFLVVPSLLPMWVLYSYSAWGDLSAGLMAVILACRVVTVGRRLVDGVTPSLGEGMAIGALSGATLYLRSNTLPLVLGLVVLIAIGCLVLSPRGARMRAWRAPLGAAAILTLGVAPWSLAASTALDARVLTTTTVPLSTAVAFGDTGRLCFGPCEPGGNIWYSAARYSQQVSRATGTSELVIQRQMSAYALQDATPRSITADVLENMERYVLQPSGFEPVFREVPGSPPDTVSSLVSTWTDLGYFAALGLAAGSFAVTGARRPDLMIAGLVLKLGALALFIQPFLHIGSPRYWPVYLPLLALLCVWGWSAARADAPTSAQRRLAMWLSILHVLVGAGLLGVGGTLLGLAYL